MFLLVELQIFRDSVAHLAWELHVQIVHRVISTREETMKKVNNYAGRASVGTWVGCAITALAGCPPVAGIFAVGFVGFWCIGAGVSIASNTYRYIDRK
jgi:hypothetical protein